MAAYHGKDALVYINTSSTGAIALLQGATEWTLKMATDKVEVTSFGDVNKTYVQGLPDISGTINGVWRDDESKWFGARNSADGCTIYLYPSKSAASKYCYGTAWFDCSLSNPVGGRVEVQGNFVAKGAWAFFF